MSEAIDKLFHSFGDLTLLINLQYHYEPRAKQSVLICAFEVYAHRPTDEDVNLPGLTTDVAHIPVGDVWEGFPVEIGHGTTAATRIV